MVKSVPLLHGRPTLDAWVGATPQQGQLNASSFSVDRRPNFTVIGYSLHKPTIMLPGVVDQEHP